MTFFVLQVPLPLVNGDIGNQKHGAFSLQQLQQLYHQQLLHQMQEADKARNELSRLREQLNTEIEARNKAQVISISSFSSHDLTHIKSYYSLILSSGFLELPYTSKKIQLFFVCISNVLKKSFVWIVFSINQLDTTKQTPDHRQVESPPTKYFVVICLNRRFRAAS